MKNCSHTCVKCNGKVSHYRTNCNEPQTGSFDHADCLAEQALRVTRHKQETGLTLKRNGKGQLVYTPFSRLLVTLRTIRDALNIRRNLQAYKTEVWTREFLRTNRFDSVISAVMTAEKYRMLDAVSKALSFGDIESRILAGEKAQAELYEITVAMETVLDEKTKRILLLYRLRQWANRNGQQFSNGRETK
jgi:hypothetical protein